MTLALYAHPLSSYCWKVLAPLYENGTAFEMRPLDPEHPQNFAELQGLWPAAKMPLLKDEARGQAIPESSIIIEYLDQHYRGPVRLIPDDPDAARQVRLADRFWDLHVHQHMQAIVNAALRPDDAKDPYGVAQARGKLDLAYDMIEADMANRTWAAGDAFSLADCAAGPALFYADYQHPIGGQRPNTRAYLQRLVERPGLKRAMAEAQPYMHMVPREAR
ncbi:glutathione S-transferase family protein [Caulobacter sp. KR2-114]|uniref:glutathione S-transferase family protein n=1 Tax=Caulobacter sp. KR2-114 TaxID=3400912 RepID=UPI003BFF1F3D